MKKMAFRFTGHPKGQSFIELAFAFMLLLTMFAGVVEAGNYLNQYIILVDGAREGARAASNADPFNRPDYTTNGDFYQCIDDLIEGSDICTHAKQLAVIAPLQLVPENDDDVVITVYGIDANGHLVAFPSGAGYWRRYSKQLPAVSKSELSTRVQQASGAPLTGMVVVEIFYHYIPILSPSNRILLHTYAIMPLTAAEPTPPP